MMTDILPHMADRSLKWNLNRSLTQLDEVLEESCLKF